MRTALYSLAVLAAAAACATSPSPAHTPMDAARGGAAAAPAPGAMPNAAAAEAAIARYGAADYQPPTVLRARLLPAFGGVVGFHLSQPAHVAIFEVDPRFGIQMIYPRHGTELGVARAGTQTVFGAGGPWGRHGYRGRGVASQFGLQPIGWSAHGWRMQQLQPRVYYLIASERPLQTGRYLHSHNALQHSLTGLGFSAFNPMHTIDRLAELVLPPATHRDEYTTDYYVEWPDPVHAAPAQRRNWVLSCPDGSQIVVPVGVTTCPAERLAPPVAGEPPAPPAEEQPQRPERRRPERGGAERGAATPAQEPGAERPQREPRERGVRPEPGQTPEAGTGAEPRQPRAAPRPERSRPTERTAPATRRDPPQRTPPAARPQPRPAPSADPPAQRPSPAPAAAPSRDRSPPSDRTENTRSDPPN